VPFLLHYFREAVNDDIEEAAYAEAEKSGNSRQKKRLGENH
jgi:hypothetical protein